MDTFQALAEPTRREIIELLAGSGRMAATEIYKKFDVSSPAISQHLKVLREARLVGVEKQAQKRFYTINTNSLHELENWVHKMESMWNERFNRLEALLKIEEQKKYYAKSK